MFVSSSDRPNSTVSGRLWQAASLAAILAVVIDLIIFGLAAAIWNVPGDFSQVNVASVIIVPLISLVIAAIGLSVIARFSQRPLAIFTLLAVVVTILSLSSPVIAVTSGMAGHDPVTTSTFVTMLLLHVATGSLIAFAFPALLRRTAIAA